MYRVAVIQNDSEMMRYSWADIRPMIDALGYSFDGYTANDIIELYGRLDRYDAIIIATNACNDSKIRESLNNHQGEIWSFLSQGKGIAVLFQMKKDDNDFFEYLPEELRIKTIKREENLKSGNIDINSSFKEDQILCFPNCINADEIKNHCLTNQHVRGLYWTYLKPDHPDKYNIFIEDNSYQETRPLLVSSRLDLPYRIIASSIALDWQGHEKLWENAIKYVVEGKSHVALLTNSKTSNYEYKYLASWLRINKTATKTYKIDLEGLNTIAFNIHSFFLLDTSLSKKEIAEIISIASPYIEEGRAEVIFFDSETFLEPFIGTVSNIRMFHSIAKNAIIWTKCQFPENHGYFAKSFWNTVDVLTTLKIFGEETDQYKDKILQEISKHDRGGCYDEVLGATCAMFEVYSFYLGEEDTRTLTTLQWILENYKHKVLFERASTIDVLLRLNYFVDEEELQLFRTEVLDYFKNETVSSENTEFQIYRYCQTFITCGYIEDAHSIAKKLISLQDKQDGKWVNVSHTAAIIELLINLQDRKYDASIDEMIFRAVEYLYDNYNEENFSWNNDVLSTVKCLRALKLFEERMKLPLDVIKHRVSDEIRRVNSFTAIDTASKLNNKYIQQVDFLKTVNNEHEIADKNKLLEIAKLRKRLSLFVAVAFLASIVILLGMYIIVQNDGFPLAISYLKLFIKTNFGVIISTSALVLLWLLVLYLNAYQLIPDSWPPYIKKFIARLVPEPGFSSTEDKSDKI